MDPDLPYPYDEEAYELLCEAFGSLIVDKIIEDYKDARLDTGNLLQMQNCSKLP